MTPSSGYQISVLTIDGVNVSSVTTYTFSNVNADHTISVTFTAIPATPTPTPTPSPSLEVSPASSSELPSFEPEVETLGTPRDSTPHFTVELKALIGYPIESAHIVVDAAGLATGSSLVMEMHSDPIDLGIATADSDGAISAIVELPDTVQIGRAHV